jgi:hypothetical protein
MNVSSMPLCSSNVCDVGFRIVQKKCGAVKT